MSDDPVVSIKNVYKAFGETVVLKDINLIVEKGHVACIIGPSGAGKSTLLRSINQLEEIDRGLIHVDGELMGFRERGSRLVGLPEQKLAIQRSQIGMVFQGFNLFPHMSAIANVEEAPLHVLKRPRDEVHREAKVLLARVGLQDKEDAYPRQLSGGQQQRVAIARALAMHPKLLLFDEPTSALDPELVGEVLDVVRGLAQAGHTMLLVTHEMGLAREVADVVIFMEAGEIVEQGSPATLFNSPSNRRTGEFLSKVL